MVREKVKFTKYAELQIQEREISHKDILNTLKFPGQLLSGKIRKKNSSKET